MNEDFSSRIEKMNRMYKLPVESRPVVPADVSQRLGKFKLTLIDEINEIDEIISIVENGASQGDVATAIADLLGDVIVYCRSEAMKYGIPLERVLGVIMDSNESKLGADGNPIYDENGKFLKGPNYWKPEPLIRKLLVEYGSLK